MDTRGQHLVLELSGCDADVISQPKKVLAALKKAARLSGATVLKGMTHAFIPSGVSALVFLSESHLSVHTWPDKRYVAMDIYTCGEANPFRALGHLHSVFGFTDVAGRIMWRGIEPVPGSNFTLASQDFAEYDSEWEAYLTSLNALEQSSTSSELGK